MHHSIKASRSRISCRARLDDRKSRSQRRPTLGSGEPASRSGKTRSPGRALDRDGWKADSRQSDGHPDAAGHGTRQYGRDDDRDAPGPRSQAGVTSFQAELSPGRWALNISANVAGLSQPVTGQVVFTAAAQK